MKPAITTSKIKRKNIKKFKESKKYRFTIIIPTFNRSEYLKRLLDYYARSGSDYWFKVIVTDSSSEDNKLINKQIITSCSNLDILYLNHFPVTTHPNIKISTALGYVKTEYSVVCPDDDFVIIGSVNQCVDFFEKNPEFTCVHGRYIRFYLTGREREKTKFQWHFTYPPRSIIDDDQKKRALTHLSDSINMLHAVYRTKFLRMIHEENQKYVGGSFFGEEFLSILPFFYGKMQVVNSIFAIKDAQSTPKTTVKEDKQHFYFPSDYKREGSYEKRYSAFIDTMSNHLSKCVKEDPAESKKFLDSIFSEYLNKNYTNITSNFSFVFHHMRSFLDSVKLPISLNQSIRWVYKKIFLLGDVKLLKDIPPEKYYFCLVDLKNYLTAKK